MVVMGGPSGVVEVGGVVDEGIDEELGVSEEMAASVVVDASTEEATGTELETGSNVVEGSGSGMVDEETSDEVEGGMTSSEEVEVGMASSEALEVEMTSTAEVEKGMSSVEVEMEITSEEAGRVETDVSTDDSAKERLGLHLPLPGRAEAEARKSGKSDKSRAVERVGAITDKLERCRDDQAKEGIRTRGRWLET